MSEEPNTRQALEAIACDMLSLRALIQSLSAHAQASLLFPGLLPFASMCVVESFRVIERVAPDAAVSLREYADRAQPSRHRAKLLDDKKRSVEEVASDLTTIAEDQKRFYLGLHTGFLGCLKRALQPDLGLSTYDGHIISTTHATMFGFGRGRTPSECAFSDGEAVGAYTARLSSILQLPMPVAAPPSVLPGPIEMRDIKSRALYRRGPLGTMPIDLAQGIATLLSNLNYVHYILRPLLAVGGHTQFRLKFIVAYHADSSLQDIQNRLASSSSEMGTTSIFARILGNLDSRWLRKQTVLRNLLVHYTVDERHSAVLESTANRMQAIEKFAGQLAFSEMDALLDRHIDRMSRALEEGFAIGGDPFWYGRVT